jgi:carbonic anhydrase
VVLGHTNCGAVQAALAKKFQGAQQPSRIELLLADILPGLEGIDAATPPAERMAAAVEANVRWTMRQIAESPEGRARRAEGVHRLVGAVCEIESGMVRFLADV